MSGLATPEVAVEGVQLYVIEKYNALPPWITVTSLARFLHVNMKPYEDTTDDILGALTYVKSDSDGKGGFVLVAAKEERILGALVMLQTGMGGYIPEHVLVFVGVHPELRGKGIGGWLVREGIARCKGDVKLHVEYDNPAKRLYERVGFTSKYAEMRISGGRQ